MPATAAVVSAIALIAAACSGGGSPQSSSGAAPNVLAFAETTTTTTLPEVELGNKNQPFGELLSHSKPRVAITPSGVAVPIIGETATGHLALSTCQVATEIQEFETMERPHVLLDPGHGGREVGAVSASGITESELNLDVALRTKEILEDRGATVGLTRSSDYAVTVGIRGHIARLLEPGLLVSIHHNGGSTQVTDKPGLLVYSKAGSAAADQFGGLFYSEMTALLNEVKSESDERYQEFLSQIAPHEAAIDAYDASVTERNRALTANGQIPPTTTTTTTEDLPRSRQIAEPTTTLPPSSEVTIPVPNTVAPPPNYEGEVAKELTWVGGGNAGVRSWTNDDGDDFLGILRHSDDTPAALVEFLYLTNEPEADLLTNDDYLDRQALALADSITDYFAQTGTPTGFVKDQTGNQNIGGSGGKATCAEADLGYSDSAEALEN